MKLNKILLSSSIIWALFLIITSVLLYRFIPVAYLIIFVLGGVLFYLLVSIFIFVFKNSPQITKQNLSMPDSIKLTKLAQYDPLTELPNGVFFNEILNKTLGHANRHHIILGLLLIDLDHFHHIREALGSQKSDEILKIISHRFTTILRSGDHIAHLEGDQFIILLNDIKHAKFASPTAEKILTICSKPINLDQKNITVTASIGICIYPIDGTTLEELQNHMDLALYKAKCAGGGVYQYFSKEMTLEAHTHLKNESALQNAFINSEFVLYFQPIFDVAEGKIISIEALLRWVNPELGVIFPGDFIPHTEENNLIVKIGEWVLYQACRTNKLWQDQGYKPITISVNLSPRQFKNKNIVSIIQTVLDETKLEPKYLALEITESVLTEDMHATTEILNTIKNIGVKICIDDFGTGYTSISYLRQFPIDILKIDQSFIRHMMTNKDDLAITTTIIALAHNMGMKVVGEGVETIEQLNCLIELKCDWIQGYYFSRPLTESMMVLQLTSAE